VRLELPDGQWAELRDALTYGQARDVRKLFLAANDDRGQLADIDGAMVRAYLLSWNVHGLDGASLGVDQLDDCPNATIEAIKPVVWKLWQGKPDPKGTTARSRTTLRVAR
jgi:hypothetical protein